MRQNKKPNFIVVALRLPYKMTDCAIAMTSVYMMLFMKFKSYVTINEQFLKFIKGS